MSGIVRAGSAFVLCCVALGCSNVKVQKVDVGQRMDGTDASIDGFRYYLNRPYILVGQRVTVATVYRPLALGLLDDQQVLVSLFASENGKNEVYNLDGTPIPNARLEAITLIPGSVATAKAPQDNAPDDKKAANYQSVLAGIVTTELIDSLRSHLGATPDETAIAANGVRVTNALASAQGVSQPQTQADAVILLKQMSKDALKNLKTTAPFLTVDMSDEDKASFDTSLAKKLVPPGKLPPPNEVLGRAVGMRISEIAGGNDTVAKTLVTKAQEAIKSAPAATLTTSDQVVSTSFNAVVDSSEFTVSKYKTGADRASLLKQITSELLPVGPAPTALPAQGAGLVVPPSPWPGVPSRGAAMATFSSTDPKTNSPDTAKAGTATPAATDSSSFQVVFLPDFEEQYAISNQTCLAKSKYRYSFRNGTELAAFAGSYNSTDVPVKILETVGALIQAAGEVAKTSIQNPVATVGTKLSLAPPDQSIEQFYLRTEYYIEPGIYRVQKSWEAACVSNLDGATTEACAGMCGDIGLPVLPTVSVLTPQQYSDETRTSPKTS